MSHIDRLMSGRHFRLPASRPAPASHVPCPVCRTEMDLFSLPVSCVARVRGVVRRDAHGQPIYWPTGLSMQRCKCGVRPMTAVEQVSAGTRPMRKKVDRRCACGRAYRTLSEAPSPDCRACRNRRWMQERIAAFVAEGLTTRGTPRKHRPPRRRAA